MKSVLQSLWRASRIDAVQLLPPTVFLLVYLALRDGGPGGISGLVWACSALCVATTVVRLPLHRRLLAGHSERAWLTGAVLLAVAMIVAAQLSQNDEVFSMRLWTLSLMGLGAGYLLVYVFARHEARRLPIPWRRNRETYGVVLPFEILRLLIFALASEMLIAAGDTTPWVAFRALGPVLVAPLMHWALFFVLIVRGAETPN